MKRLQMEISTKSRDPTNGPLMDTWFVGQQPSFEVVQKVMFSCEVLGGLVNSPQVVYEPRMIFFGFISYIKVFQILLPTFRLNFVKPKTPLPQITFSSHHGSQKSRRNQEGYWWSFLNKKSLEFLQYEVWCPSLNSLPFKESLLMNFQKGFSTLVSTIFNS